MSGRPGGNGLVALAAMLALAAAQSPCVARADDAASTRADQLFTDGKQRLAQGDYAAACPLLAESFRLDPASGALLALALCNERAGKLATAQRGYADVAARSQQEGRVDRERAARARADALARELSTLTIAYAAGEHAQDGFELRLDGKQLAGAELGKALPVDGGEHAIEAAAPGKVPWRAHVTVAPRSDAKTVVIPTLQSERAEPPAEASAPAPHVRAERPGRARADDTARAFTADEWVGLGTLGVGLVGLGIGAVFAVQAANDADVPRERCTAGQCTYREGGGRAADAAVLSMVTGGVLAAAGLVIYLSSGPSSSSASASAKAPTLAASWLGPSTAGASLSGRF